jgi:hypothetical protein
LITWKLLSPCFVGSFQDHRDTRTAKPRVIFGERPEASSQQQLTEEAYPTRPLLSPRRKTGLRPMVEQGAELGRAQKPDLELAGPVIRSTLTPQDFVYSPDGEPTPKPFAGVLSYRRLSVQYRYSIIKSHKACLRYGLPNRGIEY